jgi:uncharacterized protein
MIAVLAIILGVVAAIFLVAVFVVPSVVRAGIGVKANTPVGWRDRVLVRYQNLPQISKLSVFPATFAWVFAWFKLRLDTMFAELPEFFQAIPGIESVLDIGCGFGVAGCALLEWRPELHLFGIDPRPDRVRAANAAFGERGEAVVGKAPDINIAGFPPRFDSALMLDMIHFLTDDQFTVTLKNIHGKLSAGGLLVIRAIVPPTAHGSWAWKFAAIRRTLLREYARQRPVEEIVKMLNDAGFHVGKTRISGGNPELMWIISTVSRSEAAESPPG